jgi:NADH-quinone oxidoreductase subunit K
MLMMPFTSLLASSVHQEIPLSWFLTLSLVMFALGALGVMIRKNPVVVFMCVELMLNAVNLSFLAFAAYPAPNVADPAQSAMAGQMMVIFVMAIAAAEVAVGLGIIMAIFRQRNQVDVDEMNTMRG